MKRSRDRDTPSNNKKKMNVNVRMIDAFRASPHTFINFFFIVGVSLFPVVAINLLVDERRLQAFIWAHHRYEQTIDRPQERKVIFIINFFSFIDLIK